MLYSVKPTRTILGIAQSVAILCVAGLPAGAAAQSAQQIVGVNLTYIAANSKFGRAALARLEAANKEKAGEVDAKLAALTRQQSDLQQSGSTMSERARADLQRAFDRARVDLTRFREDAQAELSTMQSEFEASFRVKVAPLVERLSRERGYSYVMGLEHPLIAWFSPAVDISDEIVKRLDAAEKN
jgi:outer membrane protein